MPEPGEVLERIILEVATKLEEIDGYITWEEGRGIVNLRENEIEEMKRLTTGKLGLFNEDGKIEFGFDEERKIIVVDALGTLDECRFTYDGFPVSKEIARIFYRKTDWYQETEEAKKADKVNWRRLMKTSPPPLPKDLLATISLAYKAYANGITKREWFDAPR